MTDVPGVLGVVVFDFDPVGTIFGVEVRWQYAAVAAIIFVALLWAAVIAAVAERRRRARLAADPDRPLAVAEAVRAAEETVRSTATPATPGAPHDAAPAPPASAAADLPGAGGPDADAWAAGPAALVHPPVDPGYPGWTPGRTAPHPSAPAVAAAAEAAPTTTAPATSAPALPPAGPDVPAQRPPVEPAAPAIPAAVEALVPAVVPPAAELPDGLRPADVERPWPVGLRADDLLFIVAGATAGAVVFGRLGWVLLYLDWYRTHTASILDPSVGGLTLAGGVVGGIVAGVLMALVLGAPLARWLGVAVVPLLAALAAGKLAMVLGGAGQGLPYAGPWATAFAGPGPWGSLAPTIPSYPAQILEGVTSGAALVVVLLLVLASSLRRHPAALFAFGIGMWAVGRFAVASLWRDPTLVAGLNGDQVVTAGIVVLAAATLVAIAIRARRSPRASSGSARGAGPGAGPAATTSGSGGEPAHTGG